MCCQVCVFVCLCSYPAICSDLIMTAVFSLPWEGWGRGESKARGGVCTALSPQREGRGLCLKPGCPGVPTPCQCPAHPHLEDTPSSFTLSGRKLSYRPRWHCPSLSPLERRWGWGAGESGMWKAGWGGGGGDCAGSWASRMTHPLVCTWTLFSPAVAMGLQH